MSTFDHGGNDLGVDDSSDSSPELQASDADRERVVDVLRRAASHGQLTAEELEERVATAYAARTRSELDPLTADMSVEPLRDAAQASTGRVGMREREGGTDWVVSILGGQEKRGRWRVAPRVSVLNLLGGSEIDLNDAELSGTVTELNIYSILGGCELRVPHGVDVEVSGFAALGGNDVKLDDETASPDAPTIHLRLVSILGGTDVARGRKPTMVERWRERKLRKARRHELGS